MLGGPHVEASSSQAAEEEPLLDWPDEAQYDITKNCATVEVEGVSLVDGSGDVDDIREFHDALVRSSSVAFMSLEQKISGHASNY